MKKKWIVITLSACVIALAGCSNETESIAVDSITLDKETRTLTPGTTEKLMAMLVPENVDSKAVAWSSSDTKIVTVDNGGRVTAVKEGTATITAQAGDKTAVCEVIVCAHSYSGYRCTKCEFRIAATIDGGILTEYYGDYSTVVIPDGVRSISSFSNCVSIENVIIPKSVTKIRDGAFYDCTSLVNVIIPDSVTEIGREAFRGCTSLKSVSIPDYVTKISLGMFEECRSLESVAIPDSVTEIGITAFYYCTNLKSVKIPDGVTSIEQGTFGMCESLESVNIPEGVTKIDLLAFTGCTNLKSVTIPDSVSEICDSAFYNCTSLETVQYTGTMAQWNAIAKDENIGNFVIQCSDGVL